MQSFIIVGFAWQADFRGGGGGIFAPPPPASVNSLEKAHPK